jgi:hypothetical protein
LFIGRRLFRRRPPTFLHGLPPILPGVPAAPAHLAELLASLGADVREVAAGEWGLSVEAGGFPLELGIAVRGRFLRAQAAVLPAGLINPHQLLYWNRQAPLVCFAENRAGEVHVCGEVPLEALSAETLDQFLGLLLSLATRAREFAVEHAAQP